MPSPSFIQSNDLPLRTKVFTKAADYTAGPADLTRNGACPAIIVAATNGTLVLVNMDGETVPYPQELLEKPVLGGGFVTVSDTSTCTSFSCGYNVTGG